MRLHCIRHVEYEYLGHIENWANKNDIEISYSNLFENPNLPAHNDYDFLCVLGGPMNIYDYGEYRWLKSEKNFIGGAIIKRKKILGICLGAQLLADLLGSKIYQNPFKERGWFDIEKVDDKIDLIRDFPHTQKVFHWHGDTFNLPKGAINLFKSEACENQAFLYGNNILGLQFHLEMTEQGIKELAGHSKSEIEVGKYIQTFDAIVDNLNLTQSCHNLMEGLLTKFFCN